MHLWFLALLQIFKVLVLRIFKTIYVLPYFLREKVLRKNILSQLILLHLAKGTFTNLQFFGPVSRTFQTSELYFCIFRLGKFCNLSQVTKCTIFFHSFILPTPTQIFWRCLYPSSFISTTIILVIKAASGSQKQLTYRRNQNWNLRGLFLMSSLLGASIHSICSLPKYLSLDSNVCNFQFKSLYTITKVAITYLPR